MQHLTFYPLTLGTDGQPSVATLYLLYMQIPHTNQEEGGKEKEDKNFAELSEHNWNHSKSVKCFNIVFAFHTFHQSHSNVYMSEDGAAQHLQIVAIIYTLFKNGKGTLWKQIKRVGKIGRF